MFFMQPTKLIIALKKLGRLSDESGALLRKCDISFNNGFGKLRAEAENFLLEIFFWHDDDIPEYVADGVAAVKMAVKRDVLSDALPSTKISL